jgi:penicillin-binding protein 1A
MGYTPDLVAGCWFGYDQRRRIGKLLTGGLIAAPVWAEFMDGALAGIPSKPFPVPTGVKFSRICAETGKPADKSCKRVIDEAFVEGSEVQSVEAIDDGNRGLEDFYGQDLQGGAKAVSGPAGAMSTPGAGAPHPASPTPVASDAYSDDGSKGF